MTNTVKRWRLTLAASTLALTGASGLAHAAGIPCPVTQGQLKNALTVSDNNDKSGFNNHFWGVVVNRAGVVCAVAFSGPDVKSQWLLSRQIAAAKAFTANGLSLDVGVAGTTALSTAQLYQFVQSANANIANPLFGLDAGNPLDATVAFAGGINTFGTASDPLIGLRAGGTITFGGGLALYSSGQVVGGLGLSGDTACADHSTAWRTRTALDLRSPGGVDALTFATNPTMTNGHPHCPNDANTVGTTN